MAMSYEQREQLFATMEERLDRMDDLLAKCLACVMKMKEDSTVTTTEEILATGWGEQIDGEQINVALPPPDTEDVFIAVPGATSTEETVFAKPFVTDDSGDGHLVVFDISNDLVVVGPGSVCAAPPPPTTRAGKVTTEAICITTASNRGAVRHLRLQGSRDPVARHPRPRQDLHHHRGRFEPRLLHPPRQLHLARLFHPQASAWRGNVADRRHSREDVRHLPEPAAPPQGLQHRLPPEPCQLPRPPDSHPGGVRPNASTKSICSLGEREWHNIRCGLNDILTDEKPHQSLEQELDMYELVQVALQAVGGTGIGVTVGAPNDVLSIIVARPTSWIRNNILVYPTVSFRCVCINKCRLGADQVLTDTRKLETCAVEGYLFIMLRYSRFGTHTKCSMEFLNCVNWVRMLVLVNTSTEEFVLNIDLAVLASETISIMSNNIPALVESSSAGTILHIFNSVCTLDTGALIGLLMKCSLRQSWPPPVQLKNLSDDMEMRPIPLPSFRMSHCCDAYWEFSWSMMISWQPPTHNLFSCLATVLVRQFMSYMLLSQETSSECLKIISVDNLVYIALSWDKIFHSFVAAQILLSCETWGRSMKLLVVTYTRLLKITKSSTTCTRTDAEYAQRVLSKCSENVPFARIILSMLYKNILALVEPPPIGTALHIFNSVSADVGALAILLMKCSQRKPWPPPMQSKSKSCGTEMRPIPWPSFSFGFDACREFRWSGKFSWQLLYYNISSYLAVVHVGGYMGYVDLSMLWVSDFVVIQLELTYPDLMVKRLIDNSEGMVLDLYQEKFPYAVVIQWKDVCFMSEPSNWIWKPPWLLLNFWHGTNCNFMEFGISVLATRRTTSTLFLMLFARASVNVRPMSWYVLQHSVLVFIHGYNL